MNRKKLVLTLTVLIVISVLATPIVMSHLVGNSAGTGFPEFMGTGGLSLLDGSSWTTTQVISTESTSAACGPSMAVGPHGTMHVAWHDWTALLPDADYYYDIFYKRYVPEAGWTTTEVVSTESTRNAYYPSLAVGSDGTVHIAWWDQTTLPPDADSYEDIFYKRYVPGTGWTTTEVVSTESTNAAYSPSLAVDSDGTVHIAWCDYTTLAPDADGFLDIFYKRYVPGTGWTTTEVVSTESTSAAYDPSLAVGSDGTVHIAWHDETTLAPDADATPDIFYKKYVPGTGWTTTEVVSTESTTFASNPSTAVGLDGTVHISWCDQTTLPPDADSEYDIFYKRYVPGTGWTTTEVVSTESTNAAYYPSLAVDSDGTVHIAWHDVTILAPDADGFLDIFYKRYVPGTGWTTTEVVSTESTSAASNPSLAVGLDGTVHIAWNDGTTLLPDADGFPDIFYKNNSGLSSVDEPSDLSDLVEFPGLTHLWDLQGTDKTSKYTEIQTAVEGYSTIKTLLESKGYTFTGDYNISIAEVTMNETFFSGALYSHWSSPNTTTGTRALLVAAKMDDGADIMLGVITNLLPSQLRPPAGYIITNAMPYMYVEFYLWDKANGRIASWSNWWYNSHSNSTWFWTVYYWWRIYTKQYYSGYYYYLPWWYIWHWLYWKHWNLWSTQP